MDVKHFSAWLLILLSFTSSILIVNLWFTFVSNSEDSNHSKIVIYGKDFGLLFLALALFVWGASGTVIELLTIQNNAYSIIFTKCIFSTCNSLCLLLGSNHLEFSFNWTKIPKNRLQLLYINTALLVIFIEYIMQRTFVKPYLLPLPDFMFSLVTVFFFGYALAKTFWKRELKLLSILSIIIILLLLSTQQLVLVGLGIEQGITINLIILYTRITFIIIICFLAYSLAQTNYKEATNRVADLESKVNVLEEKVKVEREIANKDERESAWQDVAFKAAHKIGNPIDAIDTFFQKLVKRFRIEDYKGAKNILNDINDSIEEAKHVLTEFKSLTKLGEVNFQNYDIVRLIKQACKKIDDEITIEVNQINSERITAEIIDGKLVVNKVIIENYFEIYIDKAKIKQCFDELITNSLHFFNKTTKEISFDFQVVNDNLPLTLKKGVEYLKIVYSDNGEGIELHRKKTIFNPFHTTYQHGTGLGLAIVNRIIELHEGIIIENGEEGHGARFEIYLPIKSQKNG